MIIIMILACGVVGMLKRWLFDGFPLNLCMLVAGC